MPKNLLSVHGVSTGGNRLVVAVGEGGKILMWTGPNYEPTAVQSPTRVDLTSVWVESERSAWAVGSRGTVLHWDGRRWDRMALAYRHDELHAVWGCSSDGVDWPGVVRAPGPMPDGIWIGGDHRLIQHTPGQGGTIHETDSEIVSIWGSDAADMWMLCTGRKVIHWNGITCVTMDIPADDDFEEYYCIAGRNAEEYVHVCGVGGTLYTCDGETFTATDSGTDDTLSGICCTAENELWVTTDGGQLRHFDGKAWSVVTCSAFGYLSGVCAVDGEIWAVGERGIVIRHRPSLAGGTP